MRVPLFPPPVRDVPLGEGALLLGGFARQSTPMLFDAITTISTEAPFRYMLTPGGQPMSVAMTNAGAAGWVSDHHGYRYSRQDPLSGLPWPALPACFLHIATTAAEQAGYPGFVPDACLINRYAEGARITQHLDGNERDFSAPIVTVSLGLPATFLFGGLSRKDPSRRIEVFDGDVVVWGGQSRLAYHGVQPLLAGHHPLTGPYRFSLTFRLAL